MYNPLDDEIRLLNEIESNRCSRTKCLKLPKALKLSDPIRMVPTRKLDILAQNSSLHSVVELMKKRHKTCILLTHDDRITGIFTDRDLLTKVVGRGVDYQSAPIHEFMTHSPETLSEDDPIAFALNKMVDGGFRNVPIVDDDNRPIAIVSMGCLIRYIGEYYHNEVVNLPSCPNTVTTRKQYGG